MGKDKLSDTILTSSKKNKFLTCDESWGVVFQDFKLLSDRNIYDNLSFVLKATGWKKKEAIQTRIREVLSLVGVEASLTKYPFELSGGEQQRVAIARAPTK